ncbi:FecCD family ABC transporter permease [Paludibacterium paludis]|uniref:Iron ABC transporter n=1 Tax=Paludibacterium paludis TaxID=1225769 RepID=A0A918U7P3_9NEIS|nr:iron ABC transporter permease [Paludibacterium paludis]GGY05331.1 iron ABC transporter [Paludibacterium paludis]
MTQRAPLSATRLAALLALLCLAALLAITASLSLGSSSLRPWQWWDSGPEADLARDVVIELRLPRTLAALAVGGLLALAGNLQQILLRNPLADPYVLGTSGGACVGALLAIFAGAGTALINLSAGAGAMASILAVFMLAGTGAVMDRARLLLTGVALASFCGAMSSLLLSLAPDGLLRGMVFWLLGDLASARWEWSLPALGGLVALLWPFARDLNLLALGTQPAHALGARIRPLQWLMYFAAAMATALAVTTAGMIGFVGLIVPHALRLTLGQDQRLLLPASALAGGTLLLCADILSRLVMAPQQLPVGVITAIAGAPAFIWLLRSKRKPS